jgi:GAF domain-containing protein
MAERVSSERAQQAWRVAEEIVRALDASPRDVDGALAAIGRAAVGHIEAAQDAGVILLVRGTLQPRAVTGPAPHALDLVQQASGVGPCVEAADRQEVIRLDDARSESRWPSFAAAASDLGVNCMLCVPLSTLDRRVGTLSLYSGQPLAFDDIDLALTRLFAAQAAITLAHAQHSEQLRQALDSRDLIGQAKGILVERRRLTPEDAFRCLALSSQAANLKLIEIARHLVQTGELIGIDAPIPRHDSGRSR